MKPFRKNQLYIYTDGSSFPKPRRGGIGIRYIYVDEDEEDVIIDLELEGFEGASNNQMELLAVIQAIKYSPLQEVPIKYSEIEIRTDSMYVTENKTNAIYNWPKNKWCNKDGKPMLNAELWKRLVKEMMYVKKRVEIVWVKGHSKDPHNKAVDKLAKKSAKGLLNEPLSQVKLRRKKSKNTTSLGSIEMKGQRVSIYIINEEYLKLSRTSKYRYEIISKRSKFFGNVDIIFSELHHLKAGHQYIVTFNKDNKNPRVLKLIKELKKEDPKE